MPQALPFVGKSFRYILLSCYWGLIAWIAISGLFFYSFFPENPEPYWFRWLLVLLLFTSAVILSIDKKANRKYLPLIFFWSYLLISVWATIICFLLAEKWIYMAQASILIAASGLWIARFRAYAIYSMVQGILLGILLLLLGAANVSLWLFTTACLLILFINGVAVRKRAVDFERLRTLANLSANGPIPILELDRHGKVLFVNEQFAKLTGRSRKEIQGTKANELFAGLDDDRTLKYWMSPKRMELETTFNVYNNKKINVRLNTSPYGVNGAQFKGMIITANDISGHKEVERQLKERNEQMDLFLYKATHDLKGPLASVKGILNIALQDCYQPEIREYLSMALTSTDRLDQALIDLLHVTRLNKGELQVESVNCRELVDDILFSIKHMPESRDVEINIDIPFGEEFFTDKNTLTTILQNLIVNALKYKRTGPHVHKVSISINRKSSGLEIIVSDNGEGIREEHREKVFVMFYRGNKKSKGTGLGLYIVKQGIEKLGGTLKFESTVGVGTQFKLFIPSGK